jgi:Uma2 family endonuclease
MTTTSLPIPKWQTMSELLADLGGVPPERVWLSPVPGTATEQDIIDADDHHDRLCELVEGVMVEKPMGIHESILAAAISSALRAFVIPRKLGFVAGADGMLRLRIGLVRIPGVAYISRDRLPNGKLPKDAIGPFAPDIAVEVLSKSNPPGEMARKRHEYFAAGTRLVWEFDPVACNVRVFTAPDKFKTLTRAKTLDGGTVLKGFKIPLNELFAELD